MKAETGGEVSSYNMSLTFSPAKELWEAGKVLAEYVREEHFWVASTRYPLPQEILDALKVFDGKDRKDNN